jgi:hypothetical protein
MNPAAVRRPLLTCDRAIPGFKDAIDEFDRLSRRGDTAGAEKAWDRAMQLRRAFVAGVEHGKQEDAR